jgi:tripartite-type tricarboxylate transporter receptor subunit TctC
MPHIKSGAIRPVAWTGSRRSPILPELPTIAESGVPGYDAVGFFGLVAPAGTPAAIIERLHASVIAVMKDPAIRRSLSDQGAEPMTSTPAEYAALIRDEVAKWGRVVRESGARID